MAKRNSKQFDKRYWKKERSGKAICILWLKCVYYTRKQKVKNICFITTQQKK